MKFQKLGLAIAAIVGCASANAFDGTVNIQGRTLHPTCTIKTGSENITVTLPDVNAKSLNRAGKRAGATRFKIQLVGCPSWPVRMVRPHFEQSEQNANIENGRLKNAATTNPAKNVQIEFRTYVPKSPIDGIPIDLSRKHKRGSPLGDMKLLTRQTIDLEYYALYYATGAATPGKVQSSIHYTIVYN